MVLKTGLGSTKFGRKAEAGEDLRPHQGKELQNPNFNDALLNDWAVQHLHLGTVPDRKNLKFLRRTPRLLYARVTEDTLYCINVFQHGAWAEQEIVGTIHRNWPDSIKQFRVESLAGEKVTNANIQTLRDAGCNVALRMNDGVSYLPAGGGYSCTRKSTEVVMACNRIVSTCRTIENVVRNEVLAYIVKAKAEAKRITSQYDLRLEIRNGVVFAVDAQAGIALRLPYAVALKPL